MIVKNENNLFNMNYERCRKDVNSVLIVDKKV